MASIGKIARRTFLIGSAAIVGGVAFGVYYINRPARNPLKPGAGEATLNPFVFIDQQGVTLIAPRAEMGQGVHTTWAALIAEELDVELADVRVLHGPPAIAYYNSAMAGEFLPGKGYDQSDFMHGIADAMGVLGKVMDMQVTGGSTSMKDGFIRMRQAGASARETLKLAASTRLGINTTALKTQNGTVIAPDGTTIRYADLAISAAELTPPKVALRDPSQWRILGKSLPRIDMAGKVTGSSKFGIDTRLPGMKFASLRINPKLGGTMKSFDATEAKSMPGVEKIVDMGTGVAVVASNTWLAIQAVEAIDVDWGDAPYPSETDAIFDKISASLDVAPNSTMRDDGDADVLPAGASQLSAEYKVPYLAHATMEPMNATALYSGDALEIWSGNQGPLFTRSHCATEVGLEEDQVEVHTTYMGGGFGRRGEFDFSVYAARLAKTMPNAPVQLTWSREEDMTHDFYRPGAVARFRGAVQDGQAVLLDGAVAGQSCSQQAVGRWLGLGAAGPDKGHVAGAFDQPYGIPNFRLSGHLTDLDIPVGFWRSVGASFNAFFIDSFIDEMAHKAGRDPLQFRLELMRDQHAASAGTLEAVGEMSGWTGKTPDGVGRGVGFSYSFGTPVAEVIEVVEQDGAIRIAKAWIACDPGLALDPRNVEAQMFGGLAYGLSAAVMGEITFAEGEVQQSNFPDYDALRMHTMPEVTVKILETNARISGVGEPGTPPAAPALANALYDLTGIRARELPLMHSFNFVM